MSPCPICAICKLYPAEGVNLEQQHPFSSNLTRELDDMHRSSFNSLLTLLAILTISGSKFLLPAVSALLIYMISLRLAVNACFLGNYPALLRFLHIVPLLGTFCMAGIELFFDMQSPPLAVVALLLSVIPLVITIFHHGRWCAGPAVVVLPVRVQELPAAMPSSARVETN